MKPPYVIIRNGVYYVDNCCGFSGWVDDRGRATKFLDLSICCAKAVQVHGFVIGEIESDNPADFFTVRLSAKFSHRPGFDFTVRGVSRRMWQSFSVRCWPMW